MIESDIIIARNGRAAAKLVQLNAKIRKSSLGHLRSNARAKQKAQSFELGLVLDLFGLGESIWY